MVFNFIETWKVAFPQKMSLILFDTCIVVEWFCNWIMHPQSRIIGIINRGYQNNYCTVTLLIFGIAKQQSNPSLASYTDQATN